MILMSSQAHCIYWGIYITHLNNRPSQDDLVLSNQYWNLSIFSAILIPTMERLFYLRRHKRLFTLFFFGAALPLVFTILIVYVFRIQLGGYLLSIFEKKTMDNLTSYHESTKRSVNSYLVRSVDLLTKMSQSKHFTSELIDDSPEIDPDLRFLLSINPQFYTLGSLNRQGLAKHIVSQQAVVETLMGTDLSDRDYYKAVMKTGKPYISKPIIGAKSKTTQINISVPLVKNGKIVGLLGGFISLKRLTEDMNLSSVFYDKYSILADIDGSILTGSVPEKEMVVSLSGKEPLFERLVKSSNRKLIGDEYNAQGERVFVIGEKISILGNKDVILLSYLKKSAFDSESQGLNYTIYKLTAYLVFVWIVINGILFMAMSTLLYARDKR